MEKIRSQIFFKWAPIFYAFEHWEPDFLFSKEPDLLETEESDFCVKFWNWKLIFCTSKYWQPDFENLKVPDFLDKI